jgi:hypothetical protein
MEYLKPHIHVYVIPNMKTFKTLRKVNITEYDCMSILVNFNAFMHILSCATVTNYRKLCVAIETACIVERI